jgi:H+/Cl- antiporter ClcA
MNPHNLTEIKEPIIAILAWCVQGILGGALGMYAYIYATEENLLLIKIVREMLGVIAGVISIIALAIYTHRLIYSKINSRNTKKKDDKSGN